MLFIKPRIFGNTIVKGLRKLFIPIQMPTLMNKVRGYVYFENRSLKEIRDSLWNLDTPGVQYKFFDGLTRLNKRINLPGILIDGEAYTEKKGNYSKRVINLLRKKVGLDEKTINYDVSSAVGGEDYISYISGGDLEGKYAGIRVLPPYPKNIMQLEDIASELGRLANADNILLRGVEKVKYKNRKTDKRCIDLIGNIDFDKKRGKIEDYLKSKNLALEGYTLIDLL